ncbi:hypothetical protein ON010_g7007 [Phytophthora cinnamomi]|nr:hypothetical protein ON010_g7007 [Phytophthora cinnamomi]
MRTDAGACAECKAVRTTSSRWAGAAVMGAQSNASWTGVRQVQSITVCAGNTVAASSARSTGALRKRRRGVAAGRMAVEPSVSTPAARR